MQCDPNTCQYHAVTEKVVGNLEVAVSEIVRSQAEMRENIIQLTEAVKSFQKMQQRIDKMEEKWETKNEKQDEKIYENTRNNLKIMSIGGVLVCVVSIFGPVFLRYILSG